MFRVAPIRVGVIAIALASAGMSQPLLAQAPGGALSDRVQIELRGQIVPRCALLGIASTLDLGTLSPTASASQRELTFKISCNAPFSYGLSSAHGAMRHETAQAGGSGLLAEFPYTADLTIATDDGGTLHLPCGEGALTAGCHGDSGESTALDKDASLTVSWRAGQLLAGRYTGDIGLSLSVQN
ncbi:MAG: hypothetical protein HC850_15560 [Rhodomicrobium sp.]|nr:hypothetical protein [Rhodomicrobium sp.]